MVKWPFQRLSDLQLGDKKVTLNHLVVIQMQRFPFLPGDSPTKLAFKNSPKETHTPPDDLPLPQPPRRTSHSCWLDQHHCHGVAWKNERQWEFADEVVVFAWLGKQIPTQIVPIWWFQSEVLRFLYFEVCKNKKWEQLPIHADESHGNSKNCGAKFPLPRNKKHVSHEKNPPTFHYTGWLIGILTMVY